MKQKTVNIDNFNIIKEVIFNKQELNIISEFILKKEDYIKSLGPSIYNGTSKNSLTGRYKVYNFLNSEIGALLKSKIFKFLLKNKINLPASIQCWANTFRNGEGISLHCHSDPNDYTKFKCLNIFIKGDPNIGTYFIINKKPVKHISKPGEIMLFNSDLKHYVPKNLNNDIRISIALDVYERILLKDNVRFYHWIQ